MNTNSVGIVRMKETKSSGSSVQVHIAVHVHVIHGRLERFRVEIEQMNRGEVNIRQWAVILNGSIRRWRGIGLISNETDRERVKHGLVDALEHRMSRTLDETLFDFVVASQFSHAGFAPEEHALIVCQLEFLQILVPEIVVD